MAAPKILCDTAGMDRPTWLAARIHGPNGDIPYTVGGSDVAAIFGVSPWTTPLELWMIKKGRTKPSIKANANQLEMGHFLEPICAHFYAVKTGNTVIQDTNMYQHADHEYALADIDRRIIRADDSEPGVLECKSCTYHNASEWANDTKHFRYFTANSWNGSQSYACNLKITRLGLDSGIVEKLFDMIQVQEFFYGIKDLINEFNSEHNYLWQAGMNGRSGGYLVLYQGTATVCWSVDSVVVT
ncbi:MAG: YqaJ viral recombinase family protein [Monoglobaceae bacterium]